MRLIDADAAKKAVHEEFDECLVWDESGEYTANVIEEILEALPTVEPTLYGYKIEHLALIARVMQKDGVTPERAVQIFKDVQTIALKVIDEISGAIERAVEQVTEVRGSGDDTVD